MVSKRHLMKFLFKTQILVTAVALASTFACTTEAQAKPAVRRSTTFECIREGSDWATIAIAVSGKRTGPLISWHTKEFGPQYTPQKRCEIVSQRLTEVVARDGGRLSGLKLRTGYVKGPVICYITPQTEPFCNSSNFLMSLPKGSNPEEALAAFIERVAKPYGGGTSLQNSAQESEVDFGAAVQQQLDEAESST